MVFGGGLEGFRVFRVVFAGLGRVFEGSGGFGGFSVVFEVFGGFRGIIFFMAFVGFLGFRVFWGVFQKYQLKS